MIGHYIGVLRRWFWLLALTTLVAGAISYLVSKRQPVYYTSSARLLVGTATSSPNVDLNDLRTAAQLLEIYAELPTTRPFLDGLLQDLGPIDMSISQIENHLTVSTNSSTDILTIRFEARDPHQSVAIVNAIADRLVRESPSGSGATGTANQLQSQIQRVEQMISTSQTTIQQLETDLQSAATYDLRTQITGQISAERTRLSDAERLLISLYTSMLHTPNNQIQVIEPAVQGHGVNRQIPLKTALGAMAGLILGAAIMSVFEYSDDTIRSKEDIASVTDVPVLAGLHTYKKLNREGDRRLLVTDQASSPMAESYRRMSTKLLFTDNNRVLRSVLVAGLQDNKDADEIAANLATVLVQLGRRVVLVDTNLRHPIVSQLFELIGQPGLTDLLDGETEPSRLITSVAESPGLSVLPTGQRTGTFSEALASQAIPDLIGYLQNLADVVVLTAPSLLVYADGLVLASHVDEVLIVTVRGHSRRQQLKETLEGLRSVGAHVRGVLLVRRSANRARTLPLPRTRAVSEVVSKPSATSLANSEASQKRAG
jgi:Mrp family chromosome partitioning ATPase/capsular polysaccharide biosynthesis protein